jgi:hypothetical protein
MPERTSRLGPIAWSQRGRDLTVTNGAQPLFSLGDVKDMWIDSTQRLDGVVQVSLVRVTRERGPELAYFVDYDGQQGSVRSVRSDLPDLPSVLGWLLRPGYAYRQGDVGLYVCRRLPGSAEEVQRERQGGEFAAILNRRHRFEPAASCRFFRTARRYFVDVSSEARMVHPEHRSITLAPALYELKGARGRALGKEFLIRPAKPLFVEL